MAEIEKSKTETEEKSAPVADTDESGLQILICGGGNGAHVFAVTCCQNKNNKVHWLSMYADEAEKARTKLSEAPLIGEFKNADEEVERVDEAVPTVVTKEPSEADIGGCDIILVCLPAFAHAQYLDAICSSDLKKGCVIAIFPSGGGFELQYLSKMREHGKNASDYVLLNCLTLPWACRIKAPMKENYGRCVEVLGTKDRVSLIAGGSSEADTIAAVAMVQKFCLPDKPVLQCDPSAHIIMSTLGCINPIVHPPILYGRWKDWDGTPVDEKPLFYQGIDEESAELMVAMSADAAAIGDAMTAKHAELGSKEYCKVLPIEDWYRETYNSSDKTSNYTLIKTNPAYAGLTHPMKTVESEDGDKYVPDFTYRYFTEDIPLGLVAFKGFGILLGVDTPSIDKVLLWAQKVTGKEYMNPETGVLDGADTKKCRCAQAYGFKSIDDIIESFA